MEGEKAASKKSVCESQSLCAGEWEYVDQRKKIILESLKKLKVNCTDDSVPHIALLGSGGGERAAMGLLGSLCQMEKANLLDSVLYLGGVSGSTWSMAFLYTDPEWSMKTDKAISKLMDSEVDPKEVASWLMKSYQEEDFSLTDIWGLITTAGVMKQMELGKLSDRVNRNPNNPYPIYCATEKGCFTHGPIEGKWFEMSPHEAGFTELGFFVETSLLGSKFQSGELVEKMPEMDMVKLQGILGSALASREKIREYFSERLPVTFITDLVLPLILKWEWGTTNNFLYKYSDSSIPENLTSTEKIHLVDAGLLMNVPYPPFLGDKRDIDLIIAPEYSAGDMFETLTLARDYAAKLKKPFPEIDEKILAEKNFPKDCYVFEGKGKEPTIIYMPLFNTRNCKTQEEFQDKMQKFSTFQRPYDKEQIMELLNTAKENITNNYDVLLKEINKAAVRRQNKQGKSVLQ